MHFKTDRGDGCTYLTVLKTIELSTLNRQIVWYVNFILIKPLGKLPISAKDPLLQEASPAALHPTPAPCTKPACLSTPGPSEGPAHLPAPGQRARSGGAACFFSWADLYHGISLLLRGM